MEIKDKIPDSTPDPGFDIGRLVNLIREGKTTISFPERTSLDSEWLKEAYPDRVASTTSSEALAVWIGTVFRNAGHKVRLVIASESGEVPHVAHLYVEVWNPVSCVWFAMDPHAEMFPDDWNRHEYLEV